MIYHPIPRFIVTCVFSTGFSFGGPPKPDLFGTVQSVGTPTPAHPPVDYVAFAKEPTEAVLEHTPKPEEVFIDFTGEILTKRNTFSKFNDFQSIF